jgi:fatty acyl-CoA reductase
MYESVEREGGDITAADMVLPDSEPSEIVNFYSGSTVFLTGATGYLGKMCLEKLLRECFDIKKIYVMVRPKKGKNVQTRFEEIFDGPVSSLTSKIEEFRLE